MFRWYRDAVKCCVVLSDVPRPTVDGENRSHQLPWGSAFRANRWFTPGWTLQELIAPASVEFFSEEGGLFGNKASPKRHICEIAGIPASALRAPNLCTTSLTTTETYNFQYCLQVF